MSWTLSEIRDKVELDLDLQEDTFITEAEMTGYANDALREAREIINEVCEDYFLDKAYLSLVNGTADYALPTGIYASKIRAIVYDGGNSDKLYEIKRIRNLDKFLKLHDLNHTPYSDRYRYLVTQYTGESQQIRLVPAAQETSSTVVTVHFLREVAELVNAGDVCEIPEFIGYVFAHMKGSCLKKMNNGIMPQEAQAELDRQEKRMVEGLTNMVPDNDDEVEQDTSMYEEHS